MNIGGQLLPKISKKIGEAKSNQTFLHFRILPKK